ncbi:DNA gyrase subunit A [Bacteroidales bacterium OttesenSCG-928-B11]|nr:DNA gyrase subunit A [Bacteroidales bacterium OttesenSCG-928-B11]MDL2325603.1 DNA gyrase subunit A [Bacteroidales bacterium OttesenSCG-928-A14]
MAEGEKIIQVNIENQMKSAYIDYSMSVIVSRALPDVRDGQKPVHRRILYAMWDMGITSGKPFKKSARIVGEVLGKYHPHGDTAVYESMVRMAQEWSLRYPFIDGQGNFGSVDGDSPAAMRYTEARMRKIAEEMLVDIEKETVDFRNNFDDSLQEPTILPSKIPALLVNGSSGIAVGMATNMAPHNLSEVCDGIIAYIDNPDIDLDGLMEYIKGPDFPTGCIIYGTEGIRSAFETGHGRIIMRGDALIEEENGRNRIVVNSLPYMTNPSDMIKRTVELIKEGKIEGISNIENLTNKRNGTRIVYELKREAVPNVVLNKLYQQTALQSSFSVNNVALVNGRPMTLNLRDIIKEYVKHRHEVVVRRATFELRKAEERAHILEGLIKALDIIDEIIALIRASKTVEEARNGLMEKWGFSEIQARHIVEMRLRQLTGMERERLDEEYQELRKKIDYLREVLNNQTLRYQIVKEELTEIKQKYGDERRSMIELNASEFRIEDTIPDNEVVITISHMGYIKRTMLSEYKVQNRGGKGSKGSNSRDEDFIEHLYTATNHNYLLFFTEKGKCFWLRVYEIPEGPKVFKGKPVQNLINIEPDDKIKAVINIKDLYDTEYINSNYIILCTQKGIIKKTSVEAYSRPRVNGINAITVREGDQLLEAKLTNGECEIMMALNSGKAVRFPEKTVRPMGRQASGVRGITLAHENDFVVGMVCVDSPAYDILVVSENGYGKRSSIDDYRITNRGGKGVKTINITDKTGGLIAIKNVTDEDDLMIINRSGIAIRLHINQLRVMGRATQGVRLINLKVNDVIAAVTQVPREDDEEFEGEVMEIDGETLPTEEGTIEAGEETLQTE